MEDYGTVSWLKSIWKLYEMEERFPKGDGKELWTENIYI